MKPKVLVITATLKPPKEVTHLKRKSISLRLKDYKEALKFYLSLSEKYINKIVFIDNSNANISCLKRIVKEQKHNKEVELISFNGLDYDPGFGRAYGEFKLMDYGLKNSKIISRLSNKDIFWKVTGRLKILNIEKMISKEENNIYDLLFDVYKIPSKWMDLRVYSCSIKGYISYFEGIYNKLKPINEFTLYKNYILEWSKNNLIKPRFKIQPKIYGYRGYDNRKYLSGKLLFKYYLRKTLRILTPQIWY